MPKPVRDYDRLLRIEITKLDLRIEKLSSERGKLVAAYKLLVGNVFAGVTMDAGEETSTSGASRGSEGTLKKRKRPH
jgi:hypothetical protein